MNYGQLSIARRRIVKAQIQALGSVATYIYFNNYAGYAPAPADQLLKLWQSSKKWRAFAERKPRICGMGKPRFSDD